MELTSDSAKLLAFLAGLGLFAGLETWRPARALQHPRWRRFGFHAGVALLNTVIVRLLVATPLLLWLQYVQQQGWGLASWLGLQGGVELLVSLVVLDAFDYFWHRANHRVGFLWRFHKAHHSDTEMDVSTALRFHPGELLISALVKALWIALWGPSVAAWVLFEILVSLFAQFHHSNLALPPGFERALAWFIVTPRYHTAHHAVPRHWGDRNFSIIFSVWDRLFGSLAVVPPGVEPKPLGLPEQRERAFAPLAYLAEPLNASNTRL